jgi:predicted RND superfamily exporter protein
MPSRTTGKRKCKETLTQVKERLIREQANRTSKRIRELLDRREESSDSDSEEEQDSTGNQSVDSLALLRRDLYLGLLCLLLLVILVLYWARFTSLRN